MTQQSSNASDIVAHSKYNLFFSKIVWLVIYYYFFSVFSDSDTLFSSNKCQSSDSFFLSLHFFFTLCFIESNIILFPPEQNTLFKSLLFFEERFNLKANIIPSYVCSVYSVAGRAYNTINVHRSMLFTTLDSLEGGGAIGEHPLVIRLMKACYNNPPPTAKVYSNVESR